jgi:hypothetical protein
VATPEVCTALSLHGAELTVTMGAACVRIETEDYALSPLDVRAGLPGPPRAPTDLLPWGDELLLTSHCPSATPCTALTERGRRIERQRETSTHKVHSCACVCTRMLILCGRPYAHLLALTLTHSHTRTHARAHMMGRALWHMPGTSVFLDRNGLPSRDFTVRWPSPPSAVGTPHADNDGEREKRTHAHTERQRSKDASLHEHGMWAGTEAGVGALRVQWSCRRSWWVFLPTPSKFARC